MKITRRKFLAATAGAAALAPLAAWAAEASPAGRDASADATRTVRLSRTALPVLRRADVVVAGGGFAGVAAALALAKAGRKVVLVEPRTYLGREVTATVRPWLARSATLHDLLKACMTPAAAAGADAEIPLHPDTVKLALEDLLIAAGVGLLYGSLPVGLCCDEIGVTGLVIGNKSGRQVLACRMVIDATETAAVVRAAGAEFEPVPAGAMRFHRTLEFDGVTAPPDSPLAVPPELGLADNRVTLHRGYRGAEHVLVECGLDLEVRAFDAADAMAREIEARRRTLALVAHLAANVPAFSKATFAAASYELAGPATVRMSEIMPGWASAFMMGEFNAPSPASREFRPHHLSALAGPVRRLWCLNRAALLLRAEMKQLDDPAGACRWGADLAAAVHTHLDAVVFAVPAGAATPSAAASPAPAAPAPLDVREPDSPDPGRPYEMFPVTATDLPVWRNVDVLVVGGGTSGATAATTAAREGAKTLLVEMNPGLGGTATLGAVDSYWFGRRVGFTARVAERVKKMHDRLRCRPEGNKWNLEAKMAALLDGAQHAGAEVLFGGLVVGAIMEAGSRVRGAVVATPHGLRAVLAKVVIDASGDGDVAAFAGAETVKGSAMDHTAMWYALAQFTRPGRNRNSFTSSLDVTNVEDRTRALLAGRRRGDKCHDHGTYLAPRESRHVRGDAVVTLTDQVRQRRWPDVVNIHYSNHDVKGHTTSPWLRAGLIPPHLEVEVPYRALLPRGLDGLLVAGKAFSTTHDGLVALRMQSDLENLGGVVGLAAAQAVREGKPPRAIDVAALQRRLVQENVLPPETLTRTLQPRRTADADLPAVVDALLAGKPLLAYQDMKMFAVYHGTIPFVEACTAGPAIVPLLEKALAAAPEGQRVPVAQALAMLGSKAGVPVLLAAALQRLAGDKLPPRAASVQHAGVPPDQGAAPEAAYLIYSLGMARDPRSLAAWRRVADLFDPRDQDYRAPLPGPFCYVDAICYGAERLADPAVVAILEKLHGHPTLCGLVVRSGPQADFILERRAMLELALGKALARSGSAKGHAILIAYLDDNRALLAEQAWANLTRISGQTFGKDSAAWTKWLEGARATLRPMPLMDDLDAAYESEILTQ